MNAEQRVRQYFTALETGDFVRAAECFSAAARYSHPPYVDDPPGSGRHEVRGRDAIVALFRRRGVRSTRHRITAFVEAGSRVFISGLVTDGEDKVVGSFISEAVVDPGTALIVEYAAYSSRPAVWATATPVPARRGSPRIDF